MCGLDHDGVQVHRDFSKHTICKDQDDSSKIVGIISDRSGNPFELDVSKNEVTLPEPLINIATGVVAPQNVMKDLLKAKEAGMTALVEFVRQRINTSSIALTNPIKQKKLARFRDIKEKTKS